jgi:hypothetical protein
MYRPVRLASRLVGPLRQVKSTPGNRTIHEQHGYLVRVSDGRPVDIPGFKNLFVRVIEL